MQFNQCLELEIHLIIGLYNSDLVFLKTELIYRLDIKKMSFAELKQAIADYIYYYNNVRIQKKGRH